MLARNAAASSTSSTSVTFRQTSGSIFSSRSTRTSASTQTNVAACPRWVTSYGVIPHTYIRALSSMGTLRPPSTGTTSPVPTS